jgi:hypothetical protein
MKCQSHPIRQLHYRHSKYVLLPILVEFIYVSTVTKLLTTDKSLVSFRTHT